MRSKISRRSFLTRAAGSSAAFYLLPHGLPLASLARADETSSLPSTPALGFFSDDERSALGSLCDEVFPNATALGAVHYIETLLTAFDSNPPKIFAGGPYSGRTPYSKNGVPTNQFPADSFLQFEPLNRVQETVWKLRLYGSSALPGGYWNEQVAGPVVGLRDLIKQGIQDATNNGNSEPSWIPTSSDFKNAVNPLVLEACFSAPEYGGNQNTLGWRTVHFQGDSQPLGYSLFDESTQTYKERADFPISTLDTKDPNKMSFFTKGFCFVITLVQGGRIY